MNHDEDGRSQGGRHAASWTWVAFAAFAGSALVLLLLEHRAHLLGAWPLFFVLFCLGAHFLLHRGHGGGHGHDR